MFRRQSSNWLRPRTLLMEQLEDRLLFDAVPDAAALAEETPAQAEPAPEQTQAAVDQAPVAASRELVLINSDVPDVELILQDLQAADPTRSFEVQFLDVNADGVSQITDILNQATGQYDAIHVLSHGKAGQIKLGATWLSQATLPEHVGEIAGWGNHLTADADILFYGCNVGASESGRQLLEEISVVTGADVAASDDLTGAESLGGDWDLETQVGIIALPIPMSQHTLEEWHHLLTVGITTGQNAATLVNVLTEGGQGITVINGTQVVTNGGGNFAGTFNTSGSNLGIEDGVALGTGNLAGVTAGNAAYFWSTAGSGAASGSEFDIATLTFQFTAQTSKIALAAIFASEEYYEYVNTGFNDNYSVLVSGPRPSGGNYSNTNVAIVPGTTNTEVSIDTINHLVNTAFNRNNEATGIVSDISLDGVTTRLDTILAVTPGQTYSVTFRIADALDNQWDSVAFIDYFGGSLSLDLDNSDNTLAGTGYLGTYPLTTTGVPIVDSDIAINNYDTLTNINSATVKLTNAQLGDVLAAGSLPSGITSSINTSVAGEITLTLSGSATEAAYQTALSNIRFSNALTSGSLVDRSITVVVNDSATNSNTAFSTIRVISPFPVLNLDPANTSGGADDQNYETTFTENGTASPIAAAALTITDSDSANMQSAVIKLTNTMAGDQLLVSGSAAASGSVGGIAYTLTTVGSETIVTFTGSASKAVYQTAIAAVTFSNTTETPDSTDRIVTVQVSDGTYSSNTATSTVHVVSVNDPSIIDLNSAASAGDVTRGNAVTFTEGDAAVSLATGSAEVSDITENDITLLNIVATGLADGAFETLAIGGQAFTLNADATHTAVVGGTTFVIAYVATTGTFSIENNAGAAVPMSPADLTTLIRSITYLNTDPTPSGSTRSFTFTATDAGGAVSSPAVANISIISVNDAPAGTDKTVTLDEDTSYTFVASDFGFTDPLESPANNFDRVIITTLPAAGVFTLAGNPVSVGQVIDVADIGTLVWTPAENVNGAGLASFTFQVIDDGGASTELVSNGSLEDTIFASPSTIIPSYFGTTPPTAAEINPVGLEGWNRVVTINGSPGNLTYTLSGTNLDRDDDPSTTDTPFGDQFGYLGHVYQTISGLTPGASYTVSGYAIVNAAAFAISVFDMSVYDHATFNGAFDNSTGAPAQAAAIANGSLHSGVDGNSPEWRQVTYTFIAPTSGAVDLVIQKSSIGFALCNWDNISLMETGGILDTDQSPNTITFDVTSVNDPAVLNLDPNNTSGGVDDGSFETSFSESTGPVSIDASPVVNSSTMTDMDDTALASLTLSVSGLVDGNRENLVIGGTAISLVTSATQQVTVNGEMFDIDITLSAGTATVTVTPGGAPLSAAITDFRDVLRSIEYQNTSVEATHGDRVISISAVDAGGATSNTVTSTVHVLNQFTAPSAVTGPEDQVGGISLGIVNSVAAAPFTIDLSGAPTGTTLSAGTDLGGGLWSVPAASIATLSVVSPTNYSGNYNVVVTNGLESETVAVTVTPVADTPILSTVDAIDDEDTVGVSLAGHIAVVLGDNDGSEVLTLEIGNIPAGYVLTDGTNTYTSPADGSTAVVTGWNLATLFYIPTPDGNGETTLSVLATATESDGSIATNSDTITITINPVNDPPVFTNLVPSVTFTETQVNGGPQLIDIDVSVTDIDSPHFNGGSLTIDYSVGGGAEDSLSIQNQGTGPGQIGFDGTNVTFGGVVIWTISAGQDGANGSPLVINFNTNATPAAVEALIQNLTYANSSDTPAAARTIEVTIDDGGSENELASLSTVINVTPVNDVPVLDLSTVAAGTGYANLFTENGPAIAVTHSTVLVSDPDDFNIESALVVLTNAQAGDVLLFASSLPGGINAVIDTGVSGIVTITLTGSATLADYQTSLAALRFENTSDTPSTTPRVIEITINDGNANSNTSTSTISVEPTNDPPAIADLNSITFTESAVNSGPQLVDISVSVTDTDSLNLNGGTLTISYDVMDAGSTDDQLSFMDIGTGPGLIGFSGTTITYGGVVIGTVRTGSDGSDGSDLIIDFTANATPGAVDALLQSLTYANSDDTPAATRTITAVVTDGDGGTSNTATSQITITAENDPPVITATGSPTYTQDRPEVVVAPTVTVSDVDDTLIESATVTISNIDRTNDLLTLTPAAQAAATLAGIVVTAYNPATGELTLSGAASPADYEAVLAGIQFSSSSGTPTDRVISYVVNDGSDSSNVANVTVDYTADTIAPNKPVITAISDDTGPSSTDGFTSDNTLTISGTAEPNSTLDLFLDGVSLGTVAVDGAGNWSFDHTGTTLADGPYVLTATSTDAADNTSVLSDPFAIVVDTNTGTGTLIQGPVVSAISLDSGASGTDAVTSDNTLIISGTAQPNSSVEVFIDGVSIGTVMADGAGLWSIDHTSATLPDATYELTAVQTDPAGNIATSPIYVAVVDTDNPEPPVVTAISNDTGSSSTDAFTSDNTLIFSGTAEANSLVEVFLDGVSIGTVMADGAGLWSLDYTATVLADGPYVLTATSTDDAGNVSDLSAPFDFVVDTNTGTGSIAALPLISSMSDDTGVSATDEYTSDNTLEFSGTGQPNSVLELFLDGVSIGTTNIDAAGNWTFDYTSVVLPDGDYVLTGVQTDLAGNVTSPSPDFAFTVDSDAVSGPHTTVPTVTAISIDSGASGTDEYTNDNTLVFSGSADPNASVEVYLDGVSIGTTTADASGNWSFDYTTTVLDDGDYEVSVEQTDQAGNLSSSVDLPFTVDTNDSAGPHAMETPTVVSLATNNTRSTLTGEYDSGDAVELSVTVNSVTYVLGTDPQLTAVGDTWTLNLSVGVVAGLPEDIYSVTTTSTDLAGNSLTDVTTAELLIDLTAPAAPTIDGPIEGDDIINAAEDDDAAITGTGEPNTTLTLTVDDGNPLTPPVTINVLVDAMGNWTVPVAGLNLSGLDDGPLTVKAFTTDAAGNISPTATATPVHDTVTEAVVITGPVEGDDIVNEVEVGDVLVTGTAEPNSTVTVSISDGVNPPVEVIVTTDSTGNWTIAGQEVNLSGLNEGPLTITATAVDEAGNPPSLDTHDIVLDTIAPSIDPMDPNALTITTPIEGDNTANAAEDNDVLLTGTSEPNSIVTLTVSDPSGHTVTVTAITDPMGVWTILGDELDLSSFDQGTLDVSATATDLAGNTSDPVITTFEHDSLIAVTITGPVMGDDRLSDDEDDAVLVTGTTDPNASVEVTLTDGTGNTVTVTVMADGAGLWSIAGQEVDLSGFDLGTITITAIATDLAGNVSTTASHLIDHDSIDPAPPTVNTLVTNDQTPTLTGTWDDATASELEVTVNGVIYVLGTNPQLTTDGSGNWTLNLNGQPLLPGSVYDVSVVSSDEAGNSSNDSTANELTVDVTPPVRPTVNILVTNDVTPTITGTWAAGDATILQVVVNGFTYIRDLNNPAASDPQLTANPDGTWSLNLDGEPALNPGRYNVSASNWDPANNRSNDNTTNEVTIDVTAPLAAVNPPNLTTPTDTGSSNTDDLTGNNTPTFSGNGGEPGSTATIYAQPVDENGDPTGPPVAIGIATTGPTGLYSVPTNPGNPLADGPYLITVTFTDPAGNESDQSPSLAIIVDTTDPLDLLITNADTSTIEGDHVVNLAESPDVTIAGSGAEPTSTVSVVITDSIGNELGPIAATVNADGTWTIPDQDFSGLTDGPITVVATETDNAGNEGPGVSTTLTLDRTPPVAPPLVDMTDATDSAGASVSDDLTNDQTPTFTAPARTGVAGDVVAIYVDGELVATGIVALDGSYEVTPTAPIAEGPHDVTASFTDPAGNEGPESPILAIIIDITEPSQLAIDAPVMEDDFSNADEAPVTVVSGMGVEPTSTVEVTFTDSMGNSVGPVAATVNPDGTWTIAPTDITSLLDGPITVSVIEEDAAGNLSEPVTSSFTLDTTPPEAALIAPNLTDPTDTGVSDTDDNTANNAPTFDAPAGTGEPGSTVTLYVTPLDVNGDPTGPPVAVGTALVNEDGSYTVSVDPMNPLADGPYDVTVTFTDIAGNEGPQSPALAIIVDTTEPVAALIAPNLTDATDSGSSNTDDLTNVTTPTFDAPVETGEPGSTVTLYVTPLDENGDPTGPPVAVGTAIVNVDGSYTVSVDPMNPLADGPYDVTVTFTDLAGNEGPQSPALAIVVDTTAPTTDPAAVDPLTISTPIEVDNIVNAVEVVDVLVMGTAEPNSVIDVTIDDGNPLTDPVTVSVTTDAEGVWTILSNEVDLSTLDDGVLTVSATATDAAGNTSETVTAEIMKDTVAPEAAPIAPNLTDPTDSGSSSTDDLTNVTTPTFDSPAGTGEPGSTVTLYVTPLDENGDPTGPPVAVGTAIVNADGSYTVSVDPMNPLTDGPYDVTVSFTDVAGNEGPQSPDLAIVVDTTEPTELAIDGPVTTDNVVNGAEAPTTVISGTGAEPTSTVEVMLTDSEGNELGPISATVNPDGTWTIPATDISSLLDGPITVTATETDAAGNVAEPVTSSFTLDTTPPPAPPIVDLTSPTDSGTSETDDLTNDNTPDFSAPPGTGTEGDTVTIYATPLDETGEPTGPPVAIGTGIVNEDGSYTVTVDPQADGPYDITATFTDPAGNESEPSEPLAVVIDTTEPEAALIAPNLTDLTDSGESDTDDLTNDNTPTFDAPAGTGEPGSTVTLYVDGEPVGTALVNSDGSYSVSVPLGSPLTEGPHDVAVSFTDPAGNEGPLSPSLEFIIDTTAPDGLGIDGPVTTDNVVNLTESPVVALTGTGAEPGSTVSVTLTDSEGNVLGPIAATVNLDGTWTVPATDISTLVDGPITITATETDEAGNVGEPVTSAFDKDTTPPNALTPPNLVDESDSGSVSEDELTNDTTPTFNGPAGSGEPGSTVTLYIDGEPVGTAIVNPDGSYEVTVDPGSALADVPHDVTVTYTDPAGNEGPLSPVLAIIVDTTAPDGLVINGPVTPDDVVNAAEQVAVVVGGTGVEPTSTVLVTFTDGAGNTVGPVAAIVSPDGTWTIPPTDMTALVDGPITVSAVETDAAGNAGDPVNSTFTLDSTPPTAAPTAPDLIDASDSGTSSTDDLTNDNTPAFSGPAGSGEPGSTVTLYVDGLPVGTAIVNPDGSYTVSVDPDSPLNDGAHAVTVTFTDPVGNLGPQSPVLTIVVDTTDPVGVVVDLTFPDNLSGTGEPGTVITLLDRDGDPILDQSGQPVMTTVGPDGKWTLTGMFPQLSNEDEVTVVSTDGAGNSSSTPVTVAFFGFDSFNNLSGPSNQFAPQAWSHSEVVLSRLLLELGSNPILSGIARPGTQLVARIYSVDGSVLAESRAIADSAGNWMVRLPANLPSDAPRIVIEHVSTGQVPLGSSGFQLSEQTYSQLQFASTYGFQSTANGVLGATAGESLAADHRENLNPLNWL